MSERRIFATLESTAKNPESSLLKVFSKKVKGFSIDRQDPNEDNYYMEAFHLMVDEEESDAAKDIWDKITATAEFSYLQKASEGEFEFFRELEMSSNDLIIAKDEKGFMRFNRFLIRHSHQKALDKAQLEDNHEQVRQLKLDFRRTWIPPFSPLQRRFAPNYIQSVMERLHNLVTTSEERPSFIDKVLDRIY